MSTFPEGHIEIPVLEIVQPLGSFLVGRISAGDLKRIAAADVRRKVSREIESYTGIQRELSSKRQREIKEYISSYDASFPNSFIIAIKPADVIEVGPNLRIRNSEAVASIIDGQHRLSGFSDLAPDTFDLIVSIFIDLPIEDQAMLFATINLKQTKVNPSLVFDLYEETKLRSPQKTAHNISKNLNQDSNSPLYHRIKPLGKRTEDYVGVLSQATVVKRLIPLICKNPESVRDAIKRKSQLDSFNGENAGCAFWKFFAEDKDWAILKILINYFSAAAETFPADWCSTESPLSKTIGYSSLMALLPELIEIGQRQTPPALDFNFFSDQFHKARSLAPFTFETYNANGPGETKLYNALRTAIIR